MEERSSASKLISSPSQAATPDVVKSPTARPLYSSKLGDQKGRASDTASSPTTRQPAVPQKAWTSAKNPITGRSQTPQANTNPPNKTSSLREGQRVRLTLLNGAEFEGIYANQQSDSTSCVLKMVQQKKNPPTDITNGTGRREQPTMSFQRRDIADARVLSGNSAKADGRATNGNRPSFRTDTAISNSRQGAERALKPWVPDSHEEVDGSLEKSSNTGPWDQFAENERLFGLKTDYNENIYTTAIDKSHPQYKERMAAAERKAREIERSLPTTAHVAEERVMDFVGGADERDEEDKYSGVRRGQDFPPLSNRENKYTPPARRAPTGQATVKGAPVDPAIISSQLKSINSKQAASKSEDSAKNQIPAGKGVATPTTDAKPTDSKAEVRDAKSDRKGPDTNKTLEAKTADGKTGDKGAAALRPSASAGRAVSPQGKEGSPIPSATSTVERDVLNSFRNFATQQRMNAEKVRSSKAKQDKEVKLIELKKFADSFKLSTPVPKDLISIIAKDPAKQKQIQEKAIQNAQEIAQQKHAESVAAAKEKEVAAVKEAQTSKPAAPEPTTTTAAAVAAAAAAAAAAATTTTTTTTVAPTPTAAPAPPETGRNSSRPTGPQHSNSPAGVPNRHPGPRSSYGNQSHYQYNRNNRPQQHGSASSHNTGGLSSRLRSTVEQQQKMQPPQHSHMGPHMPVQDMRIIAPTGPASIDPRRVSGVPHLGPKLNPNSHEFRPNAFAPPFNPGPSQNSSPRSSVNVIEPHLPPMIPTAGQLIRRRTKQVDAKKCFVLGHIETIQPPQGRKWDDNDGLRPSYDTQPTWRQLQDDGTEPADSTMHLTYKEFFEKFAFPPAAMATPNPPHVMPLPHHHQLPFHLQHGSHSLPPRQSPHMGTMQMQGAQHGHVPHVPFSGPDEHRMMHSSSAQSFASPRMGQVPITYPPTMNSPAPGPYNQPVMQPFMNPGTPQISSYRSFSNNLQFLPQQPGHMGGPIMLQPQFITGPNGMMPTGPQMQMYPGGGPPQFIPPGGGPPQSLSGSMPGSNGFPSPGRPTAPMMVHQGSHQGQPPAVYGMSPGMPYQQPAYTPQQAQGKFSGQRP